MISLDIDPIFLLTRNFLLMFDCFDYPGDSRSRKAEEQYFFTWKQTVFSDLCCL